jgi:thiamine monophosphate synthase
MIFHNLISESLPLYLITSKKLSHFPFLRFVLQTALWSAIGLIQIRIKSGDKEQTPTTLTL